MLPDLFRLSALLRSALLAAPIRVAALAALAWTAAAGTAAPVMAAVQETAPAPPRSPDVHFVPTPKEVVSAMLELARVGPKDVVYDLGSGDGRIVIAAVERFGATGLGIDIDPERIREGAANARAAGVGGQVRFRQGDLFETDLSEASVVTLYLLPDLNVRLRPKLLTELRPGSRVVSNAFDMREWAPDSTFVVKRTDGGESPVHLWVIPARIAGTWDLTVGSGSKARRYAITLEQEFQRLSGTAKSESGPLPLHDLELSGDRVQLTIGGPDSAGQLRLSGRVRDGKISGTARKVAVGVPIPWRAVQAASALEAPARKPDVIFVPTPDSVVAAMLRVTGTGPADVLYDLGSGDGRIVIAAARTHGTRGVGIEIDPQRVAEAREKARAAGVEDRATFMQQDLFETDLAEATVVTLYLLPELNVKLRPTLLSQLAPGSRVVSHAYDMGDWEPDSAFQVEGRAVFFWVVPAPVAGAWTWTEVVDSRERRFTLALEQSFQRLQGALTAGGESYALHDLHLRGDDLSFTATGSWGGGVETRAYSGHVVGDLVRGTVLGENEEDQEDVEARQDDEDEQGEGGQGEGGEDKEDEKGEEDEGSPWEAARQPGTGRSAP